MYQRGFTLATPADFDNAILFQLKVEVWQQGELIDYGGIIQEHSDDSVKFEKWYFLKETCQFKVR